MVSLKDIAAECGVSVATVSKALNGAQDIGKETAERVRQAADKMGYLTNAAARALKTNRTRNLGVLFVDQGGRGLTHEFFASVLDSFKVEAERHDYDITFINSANNRSVSYLQHCRYRGFDGVGIICVDFHLPEVQELVNSTIPVVTIDHAFNNRTSVLSDNISGLSALVKYAYAKGHRKIAYIYGEETSVTQSRLTGFYRGCEKLGIDVPEEYVVSGKYYDAENSYENAKKLLSLPDRPSCIIFPDDFSVVGGLRAINELGLNCPDDVSIMGYDGNIYAGVMYPKLTTYKQDSKMLGQTAARRLIELIDHPRTTVPETVIVSGSIIEGASVADIN